MNETQTLSREIEELDRQIREQEEFDRAVSGRKHRLAGLQKRLQDVADREAADRERARLEIAVLTEELEGAYADAIGKLEDYVDAREALDALRARYESAWHRANDFGVAPDRVPRMQARAARIEEGRETRKLLERAAKATSGSW